VIEISWDDTKQAGDDFPSADWNIMVTDQKSRAFVTTGTGVPTDAPTMIGAIYYDSTNSRHYISSGTATIADWKKVITQ